MANVKITTGQYVSIEQRIASVSDRVFAQLLDWLFLWIYISIVSLIWVSLLVTKSYTTRLETIILTVYALMMLPVILYHPISEFFFNGASPGKKILKLKVVKEDGSSPSLGDYLIRWLMYLLEGIILPGIGLLCIIFNKKSQRLGDMMAGTMVIKNENYNRNIINLSYFGYAQPNYVPYYPEVATLSLRQAEVIQETLMNQNSNRDYYINELSNKIIDYLKIPPLINSNGETFLNTVLNDYRYYTSKVDI